MSDQFSFTPEYQTKILALMLSSTSFRDLASDALSGENFSNLALRWFFDRMAESEAHPTPVTIKEEMFKAVSDKLIKEDELDIYTGLYMAIKEKPSKLDEEHIYKNLAEFIRYQRVKKAFQDSLELLKKNDWDAIVDTVSTAANHTIQPLSLGHDFLKEYQSRLAARMSETESFIMPTGIAELDSTLSGGLEAQQLGLIVGGTGRGKSVFLAHLARHALIMGHSAVYYTLELSEAIMARRFDSMFARVQPKELKIKNKDVFHKLDELNKKHKEHLIIKGFPTDGATTKTIRSHFRSLLASGIKPKLIIVDYLDLLKSNRSYKDYRFELDNITKSLRGLSQEFEVPVWTASQLNRAGMAMETPDETSVAEALLKLFTVDVSVFMAQTKDEREDEIMRLYVGKNRNGPAGRTIEINTDYSFLTFLRKPISPEVSP